MPDYARLELGLAATLTGLACAEPVTVLGTAATGPIRNQFWALESTYHIDSKW